MDSHPALDLRYAPGPSTPALLDLLHAALDDFEPLAIVEHETADGWRVFFRTTGRRDAALAALQSLFASQLTHIAPVEVPDDGWARRSQEQLTAVIIGRIVVAPPWDVPASGEPRTASCDITIVIDPSMGFGTGHHETTRLCLRLLQRIEVNGRRVVDLGTGSGVLALAAWKLGAREVVAIDPDPDALANARDNIDRNGAAAAIDLRQGDLQTIAIAPADVVLANLTSAVLQRHAAALRALVKPSGALIVSGFIPDDAADVTRALGGSPGTQVTENEWAALLLQGAV